MKALICYDTKYGSTKDVCNYIRLGLKLDTDIKNVCEVHSFDYDLIVIGSPVFIGKPMKSVENFIIANYEKIRNKKVAIFVTCWAMATEYEESSGEFLEQLKKHLPPCELIGESALPGRLLLNKLNKQDQQLMKRLLRRLDSMLEEFNSKKIAWRDARNRNLAMKFGKEIEAKLV